MPTPLFYYRRNRSFAALPVRICGIAFGAVLAASRLGSFYRRNHGFAALPVRICGIAFRRCPRCYSPLAPLSPESRLRRASGTHLRNRLRRCPRCYSLRLSFIAGIAASLRFRYASAEFAFRRCPRCYSPSAPFIAGITASLRFRYASAEWPSALSSLLLASGSLLSPESPSALFVRTCCAFGLRGAELPSRRRLNLCPSIARHYRRNLRLPVFLPSSIIILNVTASSKLRRSSPMARCTFSKR